MSHTDYIEENLEPEYINHEEIRKSELIDQVVKLTKKMIIANTALEVLARSGKGVAKVALEQIKELEK